MCLILGRLNIDPCELEKPGERYPALSLRIEESSSTSVKQSDEACVEATPPINFQIKFPQIISRVDELDPMEEGGVTLLKIYFASGEGIVVEHIAPPLTLGISPFSIS